MKARYDEPDEPPPDLELINHYSAVADPKNGASEEDRAKARSAMVTLYRDQRDKVSRGEQPYIDFRLLFFIQNQLTRCAKQSDPLGAVEKLLNGRKLERGRRPTPHRDFVIAGDVAERVEAGATIDDACGDLVKATRLSFEQIRRIYFDQKKADPRGLEIDLSRRRAERNLKTWEEFLNEPR
jgi:hypothetical protein